MSEAFVLGGVRTPFTKYAGSLSHIRPDDLLAKTLSGARERVGVSPDQIEDIVGGCVNPAHEGLGDLARWAALAAGFPDPVAGVTVNQFCGSSLSATIMVTHAIRAGELGVGIACGVESMSGFTIPDSKLTPTAARSPSDTRPAPPAAGTFSSWRPNYANAMPDTALLADASAQGRGSPWFLRIRMQHEPNNPGPREGQVRGHLYVQAPSGDPPSVQLRRTDMTSALGYDVFVSEPIPQHITELVPNGGRFMWSPLSATLIRGTNDAVLVDPPFTTEQGHAVGDWVQASNKTLTHIFVTHGHGDHWFTAGMLADRFGADIIATPGTIEQMHRNVAMRPAVWDRLFPDQIPQTDVKAIAPLDNRIDLEGYTFDIVEVGHTDTDATTVLHVPDLELVVAGDAIYNGVHQFLAESANGGRDKWRAAIDIVESLAPRWIVAGHKNKSLDDAAARTITESREYLNAADELIAQNTTALGFFNAMLGRYPDRINPGALWMGAAALYR